MRVLGYSYEPRVGGSGYHLPTCNACGLNQPCVVIDEPVKVRLLALFGHVRGLTSAKIQDAAAKSPGADSLRDRR